MNVIRNLFNIHKPQMGWNGIRLHKALQGNGVLMEKARLERRSLNYDERNIVSAVRAIALMERMSDKMINMSEMEGMMDKELVSEPYKVTAKFAFYNSPYFGHPVADASFLITESNHPVIIEHGNFSKEELEKYHVKVPSYPSYEKWVKKGRPCYRGG